MRKMLLFLGFILPVQIFAQMEMWVARYDGTSSGQGFDHAYAIAVDDSGYIYVTGESYDTSTYGDYVTIKYNNSGDTVWVRKYDGPDHSDDKSYAIAVDKSGNVYVTGESAGDTTYYDYATIKYNSLGDTVWVRRYNGTGTNYDGDGAHAIAVDKKGNVYVTGASCNESTSFSNYDYATIKYNSLGDEMWVRRYNGIGNSYDNAYAITVDDSENVYVTGLSCDTGPGTEYATIKYNILGDTMWVRRYNKPGYIDNEANAIAVDNKGNVYVAGGSSSSFYSDTISEYATIKYNSTGDTVWVRTYSGTAKNYDRAKESSLYKEVIPSKRNKNFFGQIGATAIAVDSNGNVYVTGKSYGMGTSDDYATIKYDSSGDTMWARRYNGPGNRIDCATGIAVDDSGNVYVTGYSDGLGTSYREDYATIKYSSSGNEEWVQRYNGTVNEEDWAYAIALDNNGYVYVTGSSNGGVTSSYDYVTIKYSTIGVEENANPKNQISKLEILKNPFISSTPVKYSVSMPGIVSLTVYNIAGTAVKTLVNEKKEDGTYAINFSSKGLPVGIYFAKYVAGKYKETKKLVLMR